MAFFKSFACLTLVLVLSAGCSSAALQGASRHLLQQASNCTSNGRTTENGMPCCFPATYNGVTYNDCWAIDDDPYCYVSTRSSRSTLARCLPKGASSNSSNTTVPQALRDGFSNLTTNGTARAPAPLPSNFTNQFTAGTARAPTPLPSNFTNQFTAGTARAPTPLPSNFTNQFTAGTARAPTPLPSNFTNQFTAGTARAPAPANVSSINAQFSNIFETAPGPARTPAVRYTITDQKCVFPATLSNGTVVYDCFSVPSLTDTSSEASSATGQQFCLVSTSSASQPVQCAAPGYRPPPTATATPVGLCAGSTQRATNTGANCTFPQFNSFNYWVCGCYSLSNGAEASAASTQSYCIPNGQSTPALCTPLSNATAPTNSSTTNTTVAASSSSSESSSNTGLIVGLAVGIPLGLLAVAGLAGGVWYYTKRRPMARATSFRKWDEGDSSAIAKGAISGKGVAKSGSSLSSVSKYAEPI